MVAVQNSELTGKIETVDVVILINHGLMAHG